MRHPWQVTQSPCLGLGPPAIMGHMNKRDALSLLFLFPAAAASVQATPADMNAALDAWSQKMAEYNAAVKHAQTAEQKAAVQLPEAGSVAEALWKSISGKTGQRSITVQPSPQERMRGASPRSEKRDTYEFEEQWAAPAVIWFVNHPGELAKLFDGKPRQLSFYADALLESIERQHYSSPMITECIAKLTEGNNSRSYNILEKIFSSNPDPTARGYAALGMSIMLGNPLVAAEAGSQAMAKGKRVYYLRQALALTPEDAMFGATSISDIVVEQSYRLKNLSIGSVPPQITVNDTAGKPQTLPVVGKPTLLLFWNPAEQTSSDMARKLPTLRQKYPELELAAITAAPDSDESKKALTESGVATFFVDNAEQAAGTTYRVAQVPTAVLLSERCRILYIGYPDMHLQAALDSCFRNRGEHHPSVRVVENEAEAETPAIQPGAQPTPPAGNDEAPALREMPEF